jgi:hypothetical protein
MAILETTMTNKLTNELTAGVAISVLVAGATVKGPALAKGQIVVARTEKATVEVAGVEAGTKVRTKRVVRENELLRFEGSALNSAAAGEYAATNLAYKNTRVVTLGTEEHGVSYWFTNSKGELLRLPVLADPGPGGALCWGATKGVNRYRVCFSVAAPTDVEAFAATVAAQKAQHDNESETTLTETLTAESESTAEPEPVAETKAQRKARLAAEKAAAALAAQVKAAEPEGTAEQIG